MGKRLYVGNLNWDTSEDTLRMAFESSGTVTDVHIVSDRDTGRPRGFAFVEMSSDSEAQDAINAMDGVELDGRNLRVNEAQERQPRGGGGGGWGLASERDPAARQRDAENGFTSATQREADQ